MNIIGISAFYHDSACCLLQDGRLVAAAEEERFSRIKHDRSLPLDAFRYCLEAGGIDLRQVDCIAYYESPRKKLSRQLWSGPRRGRRDLSFLDALRPLREIREALGYPGPIRAFEHHLSHAASSFYCSGFGEAAVLTVDGVGEWATTTYGAGRGASLELFEEVSFPHSLGLLYSTITSYLGFEVNDAEYKVMGLAPYGEPTFVDRIRQLIELHDGGGYALDMRYFDFVQGERMYSPELAELLGLPPREPQSEILAAHKDLARSLQIVLQEVLLDKVGYLHRRAGTDSLCMAGGVALNCVANGEILERGPFRRLFVQPAAGDAGGSVGAAVLAHIELTQRRPDVTLEHVYLGPSFDDREVSALIRWSGLPFRDFRGREDELIEAVVDRLVDGKVIGWFHGRMELGPRALGGRSLLADPRRPDMRDRLNALVKKREGFRPFAPSVLASSAAAHFELDHPSPFMLETCQVRSPIELPAVTHVDGSARVQTVDPRTSPRYAKLISAFERRTGCPILVNTSFNVRGEPIVCTPGDALSCFMGSGIDVLALEDHLLDRGDLDQSALHVAALAEAGRVKRRSGDLDLLYTFL